MVATELRRALETLEIPVAVATVSTDSSQHPRRDGPILRFPKTPDYYAPEGAQFRPKRVVPWIEQTLPTPTVLHVHSVAFQQVVAECRARWRVPLVYTCHSLFVDESPRVPESILIGQVRLLHDSDIVVVPSQWLRERLAVVYPDVLDRVQIVPNGVVWPAAPPAPLSPADPTMLFVGRLVEGKGLEDLIAAMALVRPDYALRLDIVGSGSTSYVAKLQALTTSLGLTAKVRWLGTVDHAAVSLLYPRYRALVVASHHESFGLAALEALAGGLPLIATKAGGLQDFLSEQVADLVPRGSPRALRDAMHRVLADPVAARVRAERGRALARHYAWPTIARRYLAIFEQVEGMIR